MFKAAGVQVTHPPKMTREMSVHDEVTEHRLIKTRIAEICLIAEG
jgi:hypothetical protein